MSTQLNTLREQLVKVIFDKVTVLNGEETEEELNMIISERVADESIKKMRDSLLVETLESEKDTEQEVSKGAFVYIYNSLSDWTFVRYSTIADAVRAAIKMIGATIIFEGNVVTYDSIDKESAYYVDDKAKKVKIVDICA